MFIARSKAEAGRLLYDRLPAHEQARTFPATLARYCGQLFWCPRHRRLWFRVAVTPRPRMLHPGHVPDALWAGIGEVVTDDLDQVIVDRPSTAPAVVSEAEFRRRAGLPTEPRPAHVGTRSRSRQKAKRCMDRSRFWKIIDASRRAAKGDLEAQAAALRKQLQDLSAEEIIQFQQVFDEYWVRAYHWDLWAAAYIIDGGCSADGFMDFRAWLISKGEKVYENALKDPETLVKVVKEADEGAQFEAFQYVASQAWEEQTGQEADQFPRKKLKYPKSPRGKQWSEDGEDLQVRFPKLCKKFGYE